MPGLGGGASQFGSDAVVFLAKEEENGIGPAVGIEVAGLSEGLDQSRREAPLRDQVVLDAPEVGRIRQGQREGGFGRWRWSWLDPGGCGKALLQPLDSLPERQAVQMHDQIDGPATAHIAVPVHELGTRDGEESLGGVPFAPVVAMGFGPAEAKDRFQRDGSKLIGQFLELLERHESGVSLARKLTHCFMLITWLFSVSRSMRAAVR